MVSRAVNCRRRDGVFWFRRRIPKALVPRLGINEIHRSLVTSCPREAARRARRAWLLTEDLFAAMGKDSSLDAEYARLLLRRLVAEPLDDSPTAESLIAAWCGEDRSQTRPLFGPEGQSEILKLTPGEYRHVIAHLERICDKKEISVARTGESVARLKSESDAIRAANAERLIKEMASPPVPAPEVPQAPPPAPVQVASVESVQPKGRLLSEYERKFFETKRYPRHTESQNTVTFRLWKEIVGDLPIDRYTREHAQEFQRKLRLLPSSHGKGKGKNIRAPSAIEAAKGKDIDRMAEKTIKRHFSCLRQMWKYVGDEVANPKIFNGISHDVEPGDRIPWTDEALDRLLRARWNPTGRLGNHVTEETHAWFVAIGAFTGCRIEEIARILVEDVCETDGVQCFEVRTHQESRGRRKKLTTWTTKSPAGVRPVPVHPKLLDLGFMQMAERRRADGHKYLFDMRASGPEMKLSVEYSRLFSSHKTRIGIGREHVFHAFRHNVETILGSQDLRQEWVDVFMGHASPSDPGMKQSVGVKVYRHGIKIEALRRVAYAVEYPPEVCPTLLLRRVRGEVPW